MIPQCGENSRGEGSGNILVTLVSHHIFVTFKLLTNSGGWYCLTSPV